MKPAFPAAALGAALAALMATPAAAFDPPRPLREAPLQTYQCEAKDHSGRQATVYVDPPSSALYYMVDGPPGVLRKVRIGAYLVGPNTLHNAFGHDVHDPAFLYDATAEGGMDNGRMVISDAMPTGALFVVRLGGRQAAFDCL
jgi:hypothetical protein